LLRYLGGKWRLAAWIIGELPPHSNFVEVFGGAASVLLRKERVPNETYNDLDDELINLFRVLRSPEAAALIRLVRLTPYARGEYLAAFDLTDDPLERARRTIVRSHMAHGNMSLRRTRPSGFRVDGVVGRTNVARNWAEYPDALEAIVQRLRGVTIERRPAIELVDAFDAPGVMLFLDPPYVRDTRSSSQVLADSAPIYRHEMSDSDHIELLERCQRSKSMIAVCGYPSGLYDDALAEWTQRRAQARAHRNSPRTEVLWLNRAATDQQSMLFAS
jgi:DNA adenine methylase